MQVDLLLYLCSRCSRLQRLNRVPFVSVERIDREVYQEWLSREARPLEIECNYNGVADHWLVAFLGMSPPRQSPFIQSKCRLKLVSNVRTYSSREEAQRVQNCPFVRLWAAFLSRSSTRTCRGWRAEGDASGTLRTTHSVDLCTLSEWMGLVEERLIRVACASQEERIRTLSIANNSKRFFGREVKTWRRCFDASVISCGISTNHEWNILFQSPNQITWAKSTEKPQPLADICPILNLHG